MRGIAYADLGQFGLAIQDFDQAIEISPEMSIAYQARGSVYQHIGRSEEANKDLQKAQELGY